MDDIQAPSVGRIVHVLNLYPHESGPLPAIVVSLENKDAGTYPITAAVFTREDGVRTLRLLHKASGYKGAVWDWPART